MIVQKISWEFKENNTPITVTVKSDMPCIIKNIPLVTVIISWIHSFIHIIVHICNISGFTTFPTKLLCGNIETLN